MENLENLRTMENTFAITEENRELVDGVILLVAENETDVSVFRRSFTQLGIICNEYVVITRIGQRSINGYFAKKGTKKQHKFVPEMDEDLLETKVGSAGLVHGKDFFSNASDYITFVEAQLVPLAKKYDEQVVDGGDGLLDFLGGTNIEDDLLSGSDQDKDDARQEELGNNPEAGQLKDDGLGTPQEPEGGPNKRPSKKPRVPKITPVVLAPEEKTFCLFHQVHLIPRVVLAYPSHYQFTEKDLQGLQSPCNGTALFGIVTQNHPLFALPIVCENHSKRRFYHIYGRVRCPDVYSETKLPNLAQLCIQGSGGRPQLVEGKVQTNTETVKRARHKKQEKYTELLQSCTLLLHQKDQNEHTIAQLQEQCVLKDAEVAHFSQQYNTLMLTAQALVQENESLRQHIVSKDEEVAALKAEIDLFRTHH